MKLIEVDVGDVDELDVNDEGDVKDVGNDVHV
jgi:hypothetical protein